MKRLDRLQPALYPNMVYSSTLRIQCRGRAQAACSVHSLFVWYVMKVPHKTYRLGRLCYMLSQNREFCDTLLDELDREKVTKIRTAMITKYPENKEVRGIMKLCSRAVDKQQGYKLTYEAPIINTRSEKETLTEWLRKEKQWQENRVKTTK